MAHRSFLFSAAAVCCLALPAFAGDRFRVTMRGVVDFNQFNVSPFATVVSGEACTITFLVDEDDFVDDASLPTRGYVIEEASWSIAFEGVTARLQNPFPAGMTPYFVLRNDDPAVDGFFLSTNTGGFPTGVPTEHAGMLGQINANMSVTYDGSTLQSLDITGAVGTYDFAGLQVFGFTLDDGFFMGAMSLNFTNMTIEAACDPPVATAERAQRTGLPNPQSYSSTMPLLGATIVCTVDLSTTGHTTAFLLGFNSPLDFALGNGARVLVNVADPMGELLALGSEAGPTATFEVDVPCDTALAGFEVFTQAIHIFGVAPFALSNAVDWTLGE